LVSIQSRGPPETGSIGSDPIQAASRGGLSQIFALKVPGEALLVWLSWFEVTFEGAAEPLFLAYACSAAGCSLALDFELIFSTALFNG
jgi:hypothetical protein